MSTLSPRTWIGNAAAVLFGAHGAVAHQTTQAGCSRQVAYQHADKVHRAVADAQLPGPSRADALREVEGLRDENRPLWDWPQEALEPPKDKQRRFGDAPFERGDAFVTLPTTGTAHRGHDHMIASWQGISCAPRPGERLPFFFNTYPTKIKVSEEEFQTIELQRAEFHGNWQYSISPHDL